MRLIITIALIIGSIYAGWHFYPDLFKAISGKEPVLKATVADADAAPAETSEASTNTESPES